MSRENQGGWTTIIRPRNGWFDIRLGELLQYRDLIFLLVKRNFTVRYKQTILGPAWALIQPLLSTIMFTVVFGNIAALPTDGMPSFLFYMCGNIVWQFFASCLTGTASTFLNNARVFGKVYFPRLSMPITTVLSNLINFLIQYLMFIGFLVYFATRPDAAVHPNLLILATPLILLQMSLLGIGVGLSISALTVKYRDLSMLVDFGVHLWMYATPIAYPASMVMQRYPNLIRLYMLNPATPMVELFRAAYLGVPGFRLEYCYPSIAITLALLFVGVVLFSRTEKTFMDNV